MKALLLHEWHRTRRVLGAITLGCALVTITGCGAMLIPVLALQTIGVIAAVLGVTLLLTGVEVALTADYWRSGYGRMGYFTQTLPVRGSRIYGARLLYALIVTFVGTMLTAVLALYVVWSLAAVAVSEGEGESATGVLAAAWGEVVAEYGAWPFLLIFLMVWMSAAGYLVYFYFSVSVGHEPWPARLGWGGPVVVALVMYVVFQLVMMLTILAVPLGIRMEGHAFHLVRLDILGAFSAGSDVDAMPLGVLLGLVVLMGGMVIRTAWSWKHRVSLR